MNGTAPQPQATYFFQHQHPAAPHGYQPSYGYQGYAPNTPPTPKGGSLVPKVLAGLAAVAGAAGGAALWVGHGSAPAEVQASNVQLESVSTAGSSPFMTPVGQDRAGVISPAGTSGEFSGDTPGCSPTARTSPAATPRP